MPTRLIVTNPGDESKEVCPFETAPDNDPRPYIALSLEADEEEHTYRRLGVMNASEDWYDGSKQMDIAIN